ncbi:aromatic compound degradation protein PaaI [Amycolatopsis sp. NBRC 101858]|uniref:PaaI family thioesterase n=1 Tax=Amycolatopsis sp. NBRC 101858 TaxID=3032200 RepID=UPI0024A1400C|nr:PaaI family thioesterase [Amycolatopsis sp. NBRC 101858]GLY39108.1 aromatic compound degradation protein PaaI [Amycolatopsis sp. NBRC 101858]
MTDVAAGAQTRSKTITWQDPLPTARLGASMSGFDYMTAIADGTLPGPPIAAHFGLRWEHIGHGEVVAVAEPDESLYNPIGMVHGGVAATLLDSVVGCAVHTTLPAGVGYSSVELKVSYLRAIHAGRGEIRATGRVVKEGSRIAFAEGEIRDADGKLLATASGTCVITRAA